MNLQNNLIVNYIRKHILPILFVIGGIIDQSTDLLAQLLTDLNAPSWTSTLFRIIVICFGAFKLYYSIPKKKES